MTTLTLKPQWSFRVFPDGRCFLTSETRHMSVQPEYAEILQKLVGGVDPSTLTDDEYDKLEFFTNSGFISIENHPDAPGWELGFLNFNTVKEQFNHVTFSIIDQTPNAVGDSIRETLLTAGMKESETPRITIVVSDSYQDLPNLPGNMLPVIVNRMKLSVGPMVFPWGDHVRDLVMKSEHYMPKPNYKLPDAFDKLQRAWVCVAILQAIGAPKLRYARNFCEYDMSNQEFHIWAMK
jgi:hypothetical protein